DRGGAGGPTPQGMDVVARRAAAGAGGRPAVAPLPAWGTADRAPCHARFSQGFGLKRTQLRRFGGASPSPPSSTTCPLGIAGLRLAAGLAVLGRLIFFLSSFFFFAPTGLPDALTRSEERRVGKECG